MYRIRLLDAAAKELSKLDRPVASTVVRRLRWLAGRIDQIDPEPLHGNLSDFYKLRVGDYRVIYEIVREETTILVHAVGHRSKVYRHR